MISTDGGKTWTRGGDMPHFGKPRGVMEPTSVELNDGRLFTLLRTNVGIQYKSFSEDQGKTWTKPAPSRFKSPCASGVLRKLAGGRIIFVWDNVASKTNLPRTPLDVAHSTDDGKTWKIKRIHATDAYQLSNIGVLQLKNGDILVAIASGSPVSIARFNEAWLDEE